MIGTNLMLRAPEPSDIDTIYQWENDTRIWPMGSTLAPYSRFAIEQYVMTVSDDIFTTKQLRLMIDWHSAPDNIKTIGSIDLYDFDPHHLRAGIGILIDEKHRNLGFAAEALELMKEYCFHTLNLHQLYCNIEAGNDISIRLFETAGFVKCGLKKEWLKRNSTWNDEIMFQLIRPVSENEILKSDKSNAYD